MRLKEVLFWMVLLCALFPRSSAVAGTVTLPITIDPPLLQSMLVETLYTGQDRTAVLVDESECKRVVLSEPRYGIEGDHLIFETRVAVTAGFSLGEYCVSPIRWEGYITLTQAPVVDHRWILTLRTVASGVYNTDRRPARLVGAVWSLIETHVIGHLGRVQFNLAPPVEEVKAFTWDLFPPAHQARARRIVESFRPGTVQTGPHGLRIGILAEIDEEPAMAPPEDAERFTEEEVERFISLWESWDAYLVHLVTSLPKDRLSSEEKDLLLGVLLETRHRFEEELLDPQETGDFVRKQFVEAWRRLSPIFRERLGDDPSRPLLEYLAFFTASDALVALDRLGPSLGIEISRHGLIHLARLVTQAEITDLPYRFVVDKDLRAVLGLGDPLPFTGPSFEAEEIEIGGDAGRSEGEGWLESVRGFVLGTAWAQADLKKPLRERILPWLAPKGELTGWLERVRALLSDAGLRTFGKSGMEEDRLEHYTLLVLATAWQESCYRQYVIKEGKATFLRSWNGTSVGIMQVNERVWRGIYDEKHLRWDIAYNAAAGCEILSLYLQKYALPNLSNLSGENRPDAQTLARIVYAMYYGGPSQLQKVMSRLAAGRPNLMDRLFYEKYQWVRAEQWEKLGICL